MLLAISGGVDSMVLAHLSLKYQLKFAVAHCNYQLRGQDADLDEALVVEWCKQHGVTCYVNRFNTQQIADEWKKGIQETARILRYDWFKQLCTDNKYKHIATAHHANDNIETFLMNMMKGTGIAGLHGILPVSNGVIRPLLQCYKDDVIAYAVANAIPFRNDSSNTKDDYTRNAIRLNLIPEMQKVNATVLNNLLHTIGHLREVEQLYNKQMASEKKKLLEQRGKDIYIPILKLQKREPLHTICYELFAEYGFSSAQVPHIIELMHAETGRYMQSATHRIIKNRNFLIVTAVMAEHTDMLVVERDATMQTTAHHKLAFKLALGNDIAHQNDPLAVSINANKLEYPLILRKWKEGDYFYPIGMNMKMKKISKLLKDAKVPLHDKEKVWVLESNKKIVWVIGMRLDERYKVTPNTTEVLNIKAECL